MSFTVEMSKKFLPSAEFYIKSVEARYQEPIKQILAIRKEINTLRNPKNIRRASRSSSGAYTQLLRFYEEQQAKSQAQRNDLLAKVEQKVNDLREKNDRLTKKSKDPNVIRKLKEFAADNLYPGTAGASPRTKINLDEKLEKQGLKDQDYINALIEMLKDEKIQSESSRDLLKEMATEKLRQIDSEFEQSGMGFEEFFNLKYGDYSEGSPNYNKFLRSDDRIQNIRKYSLLLGVDRRDTAAVTDYSKKISGLTDIVLGRFDTESLPSVNATDEAKLAFVERVPGLTVANDRVVVDEESDAVEKKQAQKFLDSIGTQNPKYEDFIKSPVITQAISGFETGTVAVRKMEERAKQLEGRLDGLIQDAVDTGRLTVAQQSVLTNPMFARTGFRTTPRLGLLKRASRIRKEPTTPVQDQEIQEAQTQEETPEDVLGEQAVGEDGGVAIIPAIINRFEKSFAEANNASNEEQADADRKFQDVIDGFRRLPNDIQKRFPTRFTQAVDAFDPDADMKGGFNPEEARANFQVAMNALKGMGITTESIGQYIGKVDRSNAKKIEQTADLADFLNHPDSLGEKPQQGTNPLGPVGTDFLALMNQEDQTNTEKIVDVFNRGQNVNNFLATKKYGRYQVIDDFLEKMDESTAAQQASVADQETKTTPTPPPPTTPKPPESFMTNFQRESLEDLSAPAVSPVDEDIGVKIPTLTSKEESDIKAREGVGSFLKQQRVNESPPAAPAVVIKDKKPTPGDRGPVVGPTDQTIAGQVARDESTPPSKAPDSKTEPAPEPAPEPPPVAKTAPKEPAPEPVPDPVAQAKTFAEQQVSSIRSNLFGGTIDNDQANFALQQLTQQTGLTSDQIEGFDSTYALTQRFKDMSLPPTIPTGSKTNTGVNPYLTDAQVQSLHGNINPRDNPPKAQIAQNYFEALSKSTPTSTDSTADSGGSLLVAADASRLGDTPRIVADSAKDPAPVPEPPPIKPSTQKIADTTNLSQVDVTKLLKNQFEQAGFSKNQIRALVATSIQESSLNPMAANRSQENSHGLFQFNTEGGEGAGVPVETLQDPYYQIGKVTEAVNTRPELAKFKNNPDASVDLLIKEITSNFIRPKDFDTEKVQAVYQSRIGSADRFLKEASNVEEAGF